MSDFIQPSCLPYFAVPWMCDRTNSNAVSPIGRHNACPSLVAAVKCTPPQTRLRLHSFSNSVNVLYGPRVMSVAGVTPGSITDDPAGAGNENPKESVPKYRRLACAYAAQKHDDPDGYSG
jgi:hypothetical protein